jgi:hypothetical protein
LAILKFGINQGKGTDGKGGGFTLKVTTSKLSEKRVTKNKHVTKGIETKVCFQVMVSQTRRG